MTDTDSQMKPNLHVLQSSPLNAEPPDVGILIQHKITPIELVYSRNHGSIPQTDAEKWHIQITLPSVDRGSGKVVNVSLSDLKNKYEKHHVVAALECAGNRRAQMGATKDKDPEGLKWSEATICNARWDGVFLRDILLELWPQARELTSSLNMHEYHLAFGSHAVSCQEDDHFESSVPLSKVLDEQGDVLLAFEMNGVPLPRAHGGPLRAVIPGHTGARWVKWLDSITIQEHESNNFYMKHDYKILPPNVQTHDQADEDNWWDAVPAMQENVLNSVVASASVNIETDGTATLAARGYAISGTTPVSTVEISLDKGTNWYPTDIAYQEGRWSWALWHSRLTIPEETRSAGKVIVWSRAVDKTDTRQLLDCDWNLRGVGYSGVGEAVVSIPPN